MKFASVCKQFTNVKDKYVIAKRNGVTGSLKRKQVFRTRIKLTLRITQNR